MNEQEYLKMHDDLVNAQIEYEAAKRKKEMFETVMERIESNIVRYEVTDLFLKSIGNELELLLKENNASKRNEKIEKIITIINHKLENGLRIHNEDK